MPQQKTSLTTSIVWTKTNKQLLINIMKAIASKIGYFECPVFGMRHKVPNIYKYSTDKMTRVFVYKGHHYYIKKSYHQEFYGFYYTLGQFIPADIPENSIMRPIVRVSMDYNHIINISCKVSTQKQETLNRT